MELEEERKAVQMQAQSEQKKLDLLAKLQLKEKKFRDERKEILYQVEFTVYKCEMRLERIKGYTRDITEAEEKQKKIEELQATLNDRIATSKLLQHQIASLEVKSVLLVLCF